MDRSDSRRSMGSSTRKHTAIKRRDGFMVVAAKSTTLNVRTHHTLIHTWEKARELRSTVFTPTWRRHKRTCAKKKKLLDVTHFD